MNLSTDEDKDVIFAPYSSDTKIWDKFLSVDGEIIFDNNPYGVIVPADLTYALDISEFYKGIKSVKDPRTVVILGTNHVPNEYGDIISCGKCLFRTALGDANINFDLVEDMQDKNVALSEDINFIDEQSFLSHVSYIQKYFPDANILPILIDDDADINNLIKLKNWLHDHLKGSDLMILSMNFSNDVSQRVADFHDYSTERTIINFDLNNVFDLSVSSNAALYSFLSFMEIRGAKDVKNFLSHNTQDINDSHVEDTVSYHFFAFFNGEKTISKGITIMSFGDTIEELDLGLVRSWVYDKAYDYRQDISAKKQFRDIRDDGDGFFVGTDFLAYDFDDNDCIDAEQNGLKISFCKFTEKLEEENDLNQADQLDLIIQKSLKSDLIYMIYEFNNGDVSTERSKLMESFVESGADVIVGRGLNKIVPFKYYKGSLIFYSLGDFLTDSKLANELTSSSSGVIVGLDVSLDKFNMYLYPINIESGYPKMMDLAKRQEYFSTFVPISDLPYGSYSIDAEKGFISISR